MKSQLGDPVADMILLIVEAAIGLILFVTLAPAALGMFGMVLCPACDPMTSAFIFGVVPIALVFSVVYMIWRHFKS